MAKQESGEMRVQKYLSAVGYTSRRKAEALIDEGRVKVDGEVVREQGTRITPGKARVEVDGKVVPWSVESVYVAMHKPVRTITSLQDPEGRPTVQDLLPEGFPRVWPVGRLDWDSEGLVLMTNDGTLTHALTHPSCEVDKVYNAKLKGLLNHKDPGLAQMRQGVMLDDGFHTSTSEVTVESQTGTHTWIQVILHEGRNRQIRRMAEASGHTVLKLRRLSIGPLELGDLPPRAWRFLTRAEALALYNAAGLTAPKKLTGRAKGPLKPSTWQHKRPNKKGKRKKHKRR